MDNSSSSTKPKVVATIDVNLHYPKVERRDWIDETVANHLQCVLCGTELKFVHATDFVEQTVTEDAQCPHCQVRTRQSAHRLQ